MTLHWTIKSNELMQKNFCPIRIPATYLNQAVFDPTVPQRCKGSSDKLFVKTGWYLLLRRRCGNVWTGGYRLIQNFHCFKWICGY